MSEDAHLIATVHHKGQVYPAGTAASEMGEVANELGDHVWQDGKKPGKVSGEGNPLAATPAGRPGVPTASALPTPGSRIDPEVEGGDPGGEGGARKTPTPKKSTATNQ